MTIELLTEPRNFAVCKMAKRKFPGVVFQGDSLFAMHNLLQKALVELKQYTQNINDEESVVHDIEYELDKIKNILESYEDVCEKHGYDLPYIKPKI
ncbi:hypothetical protein AUR67_18905 [Pseudoalteromonas sp. XI10]|uniref:DUF6959 family protein n=1 Tax=Pseudoalteromonas sp. XI10 TaxID=1766621 RepID=UPI00073365C5|nr:hypothetical protein [Pseudoalteromonas sp. XI10]KTG18628.1 hypothetical protein AUR67_18905 [Pseudoalteromonas sp. XI10]